MVLDLQGNIVSVIQVIALLLLVVGVYPYRIRTKNRNLIMHGFLSILALTLNLVTTITVMIPVLSVSISIINKFSILQSAIVWVHVAAGIVAILLGFVIVASWITHPLGELSCSKTWKLMLPTFLIWTLALILGLAIHIYGIV